MCHTKTPREEWSGKKSRKNEIGTKKTKENTAILTRRRKNCHEMNLIKMATVVTTSSCVQSFSLVIWEKAIFLSIPLCLVALFIGGNSLCVTAVATGYNTPEYCRFSQKQCIDNVCSTSLICQKFIILSIIECHFSIFVSISTLSFVCVQSTKNCTAFSAIQSVFFVVC